MNELDNENRVLELFRLVPKDKVCILYEDDKSKEIYESLVLNSEKWIDNSGKADLPPDFLNPSDSIMMEVMRVNDTNSESNRRETELQKELEKSGIFELFPNVQNVTCIPDVHSQNYESYIRSFERTVNKHNSKISSYYNNHPEMERTVFFVCDESEAYYELGEYTEKGISSKVHTWFLDKKLVTVLKACDAQCVIWFTPYKALERDGIKYPDVVVINPKLINDSQLIAYNSNHMVAATFVKRIT